MALRCPPGWYEQPSGAGSILVPPGGACTIRYQERVVPLRSARTLVSGALAGDAFEITDEGSPLRFMTDEGEFAIKALVRGRHRLTGHDVVHIVGAIFAEDFSTFVDARVSDLARLPAIDELVTDLIRRDRLALGVRRRRYMFRPPVDWHAVDRGLDLYLYPPDYPRSPASCVVLAAEPLRVGEDAAERQLEQLHAQNDALERLNAGANPAAGAHAISTPRGLHGHEWRVVRTTVRGGQRLIRHLIVLRDDVYAYPFRFEAIDSPTTGRHFDTFMAMVRTAQGLPGGPMAPKHSSPTPPAIWYD